MLQGTWSADLSIAKFFFRKTNKQTVKLSAFFRNTRKNSSSLYQVCHRFWSKRKLIQWKNSTTLKQQTWIFNCWWYMQNQTLNLPAMLNKGCAKSIKDNDLFLQLKSKCWNEDSKLSKHFYSVEELWRPSIEVKMHTRGH